MAASRLGRSGFCWHFRSYPSTIPRRQSSFQPLRQKRFVSYQNFPRGPHQTQYKSRFRAVNHLHYVWDNYRHEIAAVGAGGCAVYFYNLEQVPITGRVRFNIVSPEIEKWMVKGEYSQLLQQLNGKILPAEHPHTRLVVNVVERLLPSVQGLAGGEWRVHVIDDPKQKNAFVMPGGKVFVFTGLLPICHDEEGLAVVLGHEIAHNVAHHAAEKISHSAFLLPLMFAVSALFDLTGGTVQGLTNLIFIFPNSRTQEAEADRIGLTMMAQSCYNPEAAIPFWERMKDAEEAARPQFLSTHPSEYNRVKAINEWLPGAKDKFRQGGCGLTSSYALEIDQAFGKQGVMGRRQSVVFQPQRRPQEDDDGFW